jgi:SAM-dependent methyltransferase
MTSQFWNERYQGNETVYGYEPNAFFKEQLLLRKPSNLLLPAEGEGRNALFAAKNGWNVSAFDYSEVAQQKALNRARELNLFIDYTIKSIEGLILTPASVDVIGLIYVHLYPAQRQTFHQQCKEALKTGGSIILEAFSSEQLKHSSGGPRVQEMLYTLEVLQQDFAGLHIQHALQKEVILAEGPFHTGPASIVQFVATKE